MNKEEIKKVKEHYIFTTKHELDDSNKRLKEYIKDLEQKESILDKVTDKLKEYLKMIKQDGIYGYDAEIQEILNIIEGEKK